jgi:lipopolysaccharide biosynthesis glycosyltransferase
MKTAIVTCATPNWLQWAAVTLLSCREFGLEQNSHLILVTTGATDEDRRNIDLFNTLRGLRIELLEVDMATITTANAGKWGVGTLLRLYLNKHLATDYSRVLYLDADTLVQRPLSELWTLDLQGNAAAAVADVGFLNFMRPDRNAYIASLGFTGTDTYFNAGVLLFDWQKSLAENVLSLALEKLQAAEGLRWRDQDALNLTLKSNWLRLDTRWNATGFLRAYCTVEPNIIHFTGRKPWNENRKSRDSKYFSYYKAGLAGHPWSGRIAQNKRLASYGLDALEELRRLAMIGRSNKLKRHIAVI